MSHLMFFCLVVIVAFLLSHVEVEIEGKDGYAKNLPLTWRILPDDAGYWHGIRKQWIRRYIAGTSYHLYMGLFLIAFIHLAFVLVPWTMTAEMLLISFLLFTTVLEDFLWFVLNPAVDDKTGERLYGVKNFKPEKIEWFKDRWFLFCPAWYWWYLPVAIVLYWGSHII